jgi:hypothetical protein
MLECQLAAIQSATITNAMLWALAMVVEIKTFRDIICSK